MLCSVSFAKGRATSALLVGAVAAIGFWTPPAHTTELILNNYAPPGSVLTRVLFNHFAEELEARSNGEITATIPSATMAPVDGVWDLVTSGVADVVSHPRYVMPQQLRLGAIAELPFNTLSSESATIALNRTYERYFAEIGEYSDVKLLTMVVLQGRQIANSVRATADQSDFEGLRIWSTPGVLASGVEATGATPIVAPFPQLFEFVSRGTVDGAAVTPDTARTSQVGPYLNYISDIRGGLGTQSFALIMNLDTWSGLSPEHQAIVEEIAAELPSTFGSRMDQGERDALEELGFSVVPASDELMTALEDRLAHHEQAWLTAAREAGLENPEEALAYYREQMEAVYAERSAD